MRLLKGPKRHFQVLLLWTHILNLVWELILLVGDVAEVAAPPPELLEQKLGNRGSATQIFRIPRNSAKFFCPGTIQGSYAPSAVIIRRKVRNMFALLMAPLARSASALVTLTRIVSPIRNSRQRHARCLDKVLEMLIMLASR
jgi:hypothetical protein